MQQQLTLNNGVTMPALGFGVFQSSPEETAQAVETALQTGYRLIDTAAAYRNEAEVGQGLRAAGLDRGEVFITTKLWLTDYGYDSALRAFDASMDALGLDQLDLYLLHWPITSDWDNTAASYRAAATLLNQGRVRAIGVSNFKPGHIRRLVDDTGVVPAVNQVELHPYFQQPDLTAVDHQLGTITQAWSPLGGIRGYEGDGSANRQPLNDDTLARIAAAHDKSVAQIMLRWHLQQGRSAIPKSVKPSRIAQNFDIFDFTLHDDDTTQIAALDTGERGGPDPDTVTTWSD